MSAATAAVLLVEDNPGDVLLTRRAFAQSSLLDTLHVAKDGEEALDYLYRRGTHGDAVRPDLILLDINLPKVDGHEVLAQVKADPDLRQIPVVMLTSSDREQDVARSYDQHANSYVTKPESANGLRDALACIEAYWLALVRRAAPPSVD